MPCSSARRAASVRLKVTLLNPLARASPIVSGNDRFWIPIAPGPSVLSIMTPGSKRTATPRAPAAALSRTWMRVRRRQLRDARRQRRLFADRDARLQRVFRQRDDGVLLDGE